LPQIVSQIVTSAYHTRRALAIFRPRLLQYELSVAAACDETAYGTDCWRHRALGQVLAQFHGECVSRYLAA